jgi:hypothetical protein
LLVELTEVRPDGKLNLTPVDKGGSNGGSGGESSDAES